jgi:hypothetical protein
VIKNPVPVTKRAMGVMGVPFERLTLDVLRSSGNNKVVLSNIDDRLNMPDMNPFTPLWILNDIGSVIFHMLVLGVLSLPLPSMVILHDMIHA